MVISKAPRRSKKNKKNTEKRNFILIFLITIFIIRFLIYFIPKFIPQATLIWGDKFHHIFIGFALLIIYFFIKTRKYAPYLLAFCLGLIVDQIVGAPFYIATLLNKPLLPYTSWYSWSPYNLIATTTLIIISLILIHKYKR